MSPVDLSWLCFSIFFLSSKLKLEEETVFAPKVASGEVPHTPGKVALFVVLAVQCPPLFDKQPKASLLSRFYNVWQLM